MQPSAKAELTKSKRGRPKGTKGPTTTKQKKHELKSLSQSEKRNLLAGLRQYMPDDLENLQKFVPKRTKAEIENYIERQKFYIKLYHKARAKVPIEQWSMLAGDLMVTEENDYTQNLSRILSIAANFEDHPPPNDSTPDYSAIYNCLAAMLQGSELPELGPLECAIILDLLHGLVDTLRRHETHDQRQIMIWKYLLLRGKVDTANLDKDIQKCRKAIENDFSDFTGKTPPSAAPGSAEQAGNSAENNPTDSTSRDVTQQQDQLQNVGLVPSPKKRPNTPSTAKRTNEEEVSSSLDNSCVDNTDKAEKHAEVPKGKKRGYKKSLNPVSTTIEEKIPKKPKMFTLNPFCIPASFLKLKLKPHLVSQTKSKDNNPLVESKVPAHLTSLSGIAPENPGCCTQHTTVVTVETPYTGRRRTAFLKRPKTTEVVVVTPGKEPLINAESLMQNIEAASIQEILKQNKGGVIEIVDSADNKLVLENKSDKKLKGQVKRCKKSGQNSASSSAFKDFVQGATTIEIINDDQEMIKKAEDRNLADSSQGNCGYTGEGGVMIPTTDQQMIDFQLVSQGQGYELQEINSSVQSNAKRNQNFTYIHEGDSQGGKMRKLSSS